jgi:hypothetical protein
MKVKRVLVGDAADMSWNIKDIPKEIPFKIRQHDEDSYTATYYEEVERRVLKCEECGKCFIGTEQYFCSDVCYELEFEKYLEDKADKDMEAVR